MECDSKNSVAQVIRICCDSRKGECPYYMHIKDEQQNLDLHLCLRKADEIRNDS